jgi:hypothetical protein
VSVTGSNENATAQIVEPITQASTCEVGFGLIAPDRSGQH